jgi:uncharacterized membrane protein (UPF0127 family)
MVSGTRGTTMRKLSPKIKIYLFLLIFLFIAGCNIGKNNRESIKTIEVGNHIIEIEIADTPEEWETGLSYRDTLPENHGMLFVFPDESRRAFWMRGCHFDIDLAYIKANGTISEIITMKKEPLYTPPNFLKTYPSQSTRIKFALEMIGGWFEEHNVNVGTRINLDRL